MKLFISIILLFFLSSCQTIENKADNIGKKEIKEITKFLQQPESELKVVMGEPDKIINDDKLYDNANELLEKGNALLDTLINNPS